MKFVIKEKRPLITEGLAERAEAEKAERKRQEAQGWKEWAESHEDKRTAATLNNLAVNMSKAKDDMNAEIAEAENDYRESVKKIKTRYRAKYGVRDWNKDDELIWKEFASGFNKK